MGSLQQTGLVARRNTRRQHESGSPHCLVPVHIRHPLPPHIQQDPQTPLPLYPLIPTFQYQNQANQDSQTSSLQTCSRSLCTPTSSSHSICPSSSFIFSSKIHSARTL